MMKTSRRALLKLIAAAPVLAKAPLAKAAHTFTITGTTVVTGMTGTMSNMLSSAVTPTRAGIDAVIASLRYPPRVFASRLIVPAALFEQAQRETMWRQFR